MRCAAAHDGTRAASACPAYRGPLPGCSVASSAFSSLGAALARSVDAGRRSPIASRSQHVSAALVGRQAASVVGSPVDHLRGSLTRCSGLTSNFFGLLVALVPGLTSAPALVLASSDFQHAVGPHVASVHLAVSVTFASAALASGFVAHASSERVPAELAFRGELSPDLEHVLAATALRVIFGPLVVSAFAATIAASPSLVTELSSAGLPSEPEPVVAAYRPSIRVPSASHQHAFA